MAQKNRSLAAKAERAARERRIFAQAERLKSEANERPLSDQMYLIAALASRSEIVEIAGVRVSRCDDVTARKATRRGIVATHW